MGAQHVGGHAQHGGIGQRGQIVLQPPALQRVGPDDVAADMHRGEGELAGRVGPETTDPARLQQEHVA